MCDFCNQDPCPHKRPLYRPGTPLDVIIRDGWRRDFNIRQTLLEAKQMGFAVTPFEVMDTWIALD